MVAETTGVRVRLLCWIGGWRVTVAEAQRIADGLRSDAEYDIEDHREIWEALTYLLQERATIIALIDEHQYCNSYDCGDCIGMIRRTLAGESHQ